MCAWCEGKENVYTRLADLESHVKKVHREVTMSKDQFTRANGFYFAKYPEDYAKVVDNINPYDSKAAYEARKAMRSWSDTFSDKQARGDQWTAGWRKGLEILRGMAKKRESRERSVSRDKRTVVEKSARTESEWNGKIAVRLLSWKKAQARK
ncbi:hypothetical protein DPMN_178054 [Dreissena polymorpha]|uniref:Uncharacterized protein n=1 Tax=Dreissena polymorpha TaxID=45954 RepID=A0A9D4EC58_DREPO|nr:hypothetical protein DPMN_178054 [Dreissena polymorpha]